MADHIREVSECAPTLRLRQASHEKALFRGSAVLRGVSTMPALGSSTTTGEIYPRAPLEEMNEGLVIGQ